VARVVKRAFRYRFYPSDEQAAELSRTFGCVRKVYNLALAARTEAWTLRQERINYNATSAMLTAWKKTDELAFLNDVSSVPLQQALRHLQVAFTNFFAKRARYPTFKSKKKSRRSAEYTATALRLARAQRDLARKERGSANRAKARRRVARIHARIADRRRDQLHKLTTGLVRDNQTIVIEDLAVANMVKNHALARAISDAAWRQLRTMLEYKAAWYGRQVIAVDRWYPSSKLCSACGLLAEQMPLNVRKWTCRCGTTHDRDVNAALNILAAGLAVAACGAGVRPQRESSRTGQSAVKQETPGTTQGIPAL
jgi:putative transposase